MSTPLIRDPLLLWTRGRVLAVSRDGRRLALDVRYRDGRGHYAPSPRPPLVAPRPLAMPAEFAAAGAIFLYAVPWDAPHTPACFADPAYVRAVRAEPFWWVEDVPTLEALAGVGGRRVPTGERLLRRLAGPDRYAPSPALVAAAAAAWARHPGLWPLLDPEDVA